MSYRSVSARGEARAIRGGRIAPLDQQPEVEDARPNPRIHGTLSVGPTRGAAEAAQQGGRIATGTYERVRSLNGRLATGRTPSDAAEALERGMAEDPVPSEPQPSRFVNDYASPALPTARDRAGARRRKG